MPSQNKRTSRDGGLTRRWWSSNQYSTTSDLCCLHNLDNRAGSLTCSMLADHALCGVVRLEPFVKAKTG